jgi:hypothetical protein
MRFEGGDEEEVTFPSKHLFRNAEKARKKVPDDMVAVKALGREVKDFDEVTWVYLPIGWVSHVTKKVKRIKEREMLRDSL